MYLIKSLLNTRIINTQEVILKSGQKSNFYFDFKSLSKHPELLNNISYELSKLITNFNATLIGVPMGGIPYSVQISSILNMPYILVRSNLKQYGMNKQLEGYNGENIEVILIEDVITTGKSVLEMIDLLKCSYRNCIKIVQIICILDREAGGTEKLRKMGYNVSSLYNLSNVLDYMFNHNEVPLKTNKFVNKLLNIAKMKKSNLIVSLDLDDENKIMKTIDEMGDHVCAVTLACDTPLRELPRGQFSAAQASPPGFLQRVRLLPLGRRSGRRDRRPRGKPAPARMVAR